MWVPTQSRDTIRPWPLFRLQAATKGCYKALDSQLFVLLKRRHLRRVALCPPPSAVFLHSTHHLIPTFDDQKMIQTRSILIFCAAALCLPVISPIARASDSHSDPFAPNK